jgi:predicted DNA-binding transcriptional regulator AlpA
MLKNMRLLQMAHNVDPVRPTRILRIKDVMKRAAIARSTIYDWLNPNHHDMIPRFPSSVAWALNQLAGWSLNWTTG